MIARWSHMRFRLALQVLLSLGQGRAAEACAARRLRQYPDETHALATRAAVG